MCVNVDYTSSMGYTNNLSMCLANRVCKKGYKRCVNGRCVGHSSWCNGRDDCGDNSDELFCNGKTYKKLPVQHRMTMTLRSNFPYIEII